MQVRGSPDMTAPSDAAARPCVRLSGRPAAHLIDWAAIKHPRPASGPAADRAKVPVMIATGGSGITHSSRPRFRPHGELHKFARPVRPLRQALTTTEGNWKLPARLLRDTFRRLSSPLSLPRGWSARPLAPEEIPQGLWPQPSPATAVTARDPGFYRYFLDSPVTRHVLFGLEKSRELVGYFWSLSRTSRLHRGSLAALHEGRGLRWLPDGGGRGRSKGMSTKSGLGLDRASGSASSRGLPRDRAVAFSTIARS